MQPKFDIGQQVKFINDPDSHKGNIISYSFDGDTFTYRLTSEVYDPELNQMISGIKICKQDELLEVK